MNFFKIVLKFLFAILLLSWLVQSGKLDFGLMKKSLAYPGSWFLAIVLSLIPLILCAYRWRMILSSKITAKLPIKKILVCHWIGLLFNTALPGVVSGDFIKLYYARHLSKDQALSKTFLFSTLIVDRFIGLVALIFLLGLSTLFHYREYFDHSGPLSFLAQINMLFFLGGLAFMAVLFLPKKLQAPLLKWPAKLPKGDKMTALLQSFWEIGEKKNIVFKALALGIFCHAMNIASFWVISSPFLTIPLSIDQYMTFVPVGFTTMAIPLTPAGLGIGHAVFDKLFSIFGVDSGASLFNLYFIISVSLNLLGIIPYIFFRQLMGYARGTNPLT